MFIINDNYKYIYIILILFIFNNLYEKKNTKDEDVTHINKFKQYLELLNIVF